MTRIQRENVQRLVEYKLVGLYLEQGYVVVDVPAAVPEAAVVPDAPELLDDGELSPLICEGGLYLTQLQGKKLREELTRRGVHLHGRETNAQLAKKRDVLVAEIKTNRKA